MLTKYQNLVLRTLYGITPLLHSTPFSYLLDAPVYLKLESTQSSGSFKDRGMANFLSTLSSAYGATKFVSSSGGNAGYSVATIGRKLGVPVTVIVPKTTKPLMLERIRMQGADVEVYGENWNEADAKARSLCKNPPSYTDIDDNADGVAPGKVQYISPYDHPLIWEGHGTIIDELAEDYRTKSLVGLSPDQQGQGHKHQSSSSSSSSSSSRRPSAIVVSVGGGGLLCGLYEGLQRNGWDDVAVIAVETAGAHSFHLAWREHYLPSRAHAGAQARAQMRTRGAGAQGGKGAVEEGLDGEVVQGWCLPPFGDSLDGGRPIPVPSPTIGAVSTGTGPPMALAMPMPSLHGIRSVATSLGALSVTPSAITRAMGHRGPTYSVVVEDREAISACLSLADHHRTMVEPACGAAVAVVASPKYKPLWDTIATTAATASTAAATTTTSTASTASTANTASGGEDEVDSGNCGKDGKDGSIVVVVCGGSGVNLEILNGFAAEL